ncbi:MAG: hypothetical protein ACLPKE_09145, partial [Streptosporangiaceae bacterium]
MTLLRLRTARTGVSAREWGRLTAMFLFILAINILGWGIYVLYVMPHHFDYRGEGGSKGLGVGLGVAITAWFLGFHRRACFRRLPANRSDPGQRQAKSDHKLG